MADMIEDENLGVHETGYYELSVGCWYDVAGQSNKPKCVELYSIEAVVLWRRKMKNGLTKVFDKAQVIEDSGRLCYNKT